MLNLLVVSIANLSQLQHSLSSTRQWFASLRRVLRRRSPKIMFNLILPCFPGHLLMSANLYVGIVYFVEGETSLAYANIDIALRPILGAKQYWPRSSHPSTTSSISGGFSTRDGSTQCAHASATTTTYLPRGTLTLIGVVYRHDLY